MKVHDVSLVIRAGMPTWPGEDGPRMTPLRRIKEGDSANVSVVTFGNHTGTHVDPPIHFIDGARTVDKLPVDALVGPCRVLAYEDAGHINAAWLDRAGVPAGTERILFKTRNSERWREPMPPFDRDFVALDRTAARWCVDHRLVLVGIDYLSIEPQGPEKEGYPTHKQLLGAGIVIIEGLDLKDVRAGDYEIACGAIKFEDGDGAPARVFLIER
jgi:arylformamidase